jgi:hypothetical protein
MHEGKIQMYQGKIYLRGKKIQMYEGKIQMHQEKIYLRGGKMYLQEGKNKVTVTGKILSWCLKLAA